MRRGGVAPTLIGLAACGSRGARRPGGTTAPGSTARPRRVPVPGPLSGRARRRAVAGVGAGGAHRRVFPVAWFAASRWLALGHVRGRQLAAAGISSARWLADGYVHGTGDCPSPGSSAKPAERCAHGRRLRRAARPGRSPEPLPPPLPVRQSPRKSGVPDQRRQDGAQRRRPAHCDGDSRMSLPSVALLARSAARPAWRGAPPAGSPA